MTKLESTEVLDLHEIILLEYSKGRNYRSWEAQVMKEIVVECDLFL